MTANNIPEHSPESMHLGTLPGSAGPHVAPLQVTIGFVGTASAGHRLSQIAAQAGHAHPAVRLICVAVESPPSASENAIRLAEKVDVVLFSGPLPYDLSMARGGLPVPSLYIPPGGSALSTALVRAALDGTIDLCRVSIDTVSRAEVDELYEELEVSSSEVQIMEYREGATVDDYLTFHRELFANECTSGVITTLPDVARELGAQYVPTVTMRPDAHAMRAALTTARLVGEGASLDNERMAAVVVRIPDDVAPRRRGVTNLRFSQLRLNLMQAVLREAREMDGLVLPRDDTSVLMCVALGPLRDATDDLSAVSFIERIREDLGFTPDVGVGIGRTVLDAEEHADDASARSAAARTSSGRTDLSGSEPIAFLVGPDGSAVQIPVERGNSPYPPPPSHASTQTAMLDRILGALTQAGEDTQVVEAEQVSRALGVNLRTARRYLQDLVRADLAWKLPPTRPHGVGRPRTPYRLLSGRM